MIELPHDPVDQRPGTWWRLSGGSVSIRCAMCKRMATLRDGPAAPLRADGTRGHDIAADGTVTPSIVCPHCGEGWHVYGRLIGWTP